MNCWLLWASAVMMLLAGIACIWLVIANLFPLKFDFPLGVLGLSLFSGGITTFEGTPITLRAILIGSGVLLLLLAVHYTLRPRRR